MDWKNKKILVTGGAGVIGRELVKKLVDLKVQLLCIDREPKPRGMSSAVEYCRADISKTDLSVILDFNPEIVFHLAASFERTQETPEFWEINFRDNIVVSHRIIEIAKKLNDLKKFIFASSYLIYSPLLYLFDKPAEVVHLLRESDILETRNLIGAAKYYTEKELEFMYITRGNFSTISARIFRVYGCGSRDVISRWVRRALNKEELIMFQKENMFDYIFAADVAWGLIKIAEKCRGMEVINIGRGYATKIAKIVQIIKERIPDVKIKETMPGGLFEASCADMSKFAEQTKVRLSTTLEEGIGKIVSYEKEILSRRKYASR